MIKAFVRCFNFCSSPVFENDDDVTNEPAGADVSKQLRLTLADASNAVLAQVCIIAFYPECGTC